MNDIPSYPILSAAELLGPIVKRVYADLPADHIPFPLPELDHLTGNGLAPGKLIVIAGHHAHGSTTLALEIARHAAVALEIPTRVTTLMASPEEITQRILAAQSGVPIVRLATATLTSNDSTRLSTGLSDLKAAPLYIDEDTGALSGYSHFSVDGQDTKLVVIDGAHLLRDRTFAETEHDRAASVARELKMLTKAGVGVVVTLPLIGINRTPSLIQFGYGQAFVEFADMVLLTYRPDAVEREDPRAGEIDITVAKHRNGPTGVVTACFQAPYGRIISFTK